MLFHRAMQFWVQTAKFVWRRGAAATFQSVSVELQDVVLLCVRPSRVRL